MARSIAAAFLLATAFVPATLVHGLLTFSTDHLRIAAVDHRSSSGGRP